MDLENKTLKEEEIGLSTNCVLFTDDFSLFTKIESNNEKMQLEKEKEIINWLSLHHFEIEFPKLIHYEQIKDHNYLLMTGLKGINP